MALKLSRRTATGACVLLAALLLAWIFLSGVADTQKTWIEMVYFDLSFPDGSVRTADEGYGPMNSGPGLDLPPGTYHVKWIARADGENRLLLQTSNGARIEPSEIALSPDRDTDEAVFTVLEQAEDVQCVFSFDSGSAIDVVDLRLYSPFYRDHTFTLLLLVLSACALWGMRKRLGRQSRARLLICACAVMICCVPSFQDNLVLGHDTQFHLARLANLADALLSGQFPARVGGFSYNGYGAATSVFYPDLFLYPFALLLNAGASMTYVMHLLLIAISVCAAASMYALAKRVLGDANAAVCACVLYTLSSYRLSDVYIRCALGEALAMSALPLFLLGLWETLLGDARRWPILAAGAACVCLSHVLTTVLCAILAVGVTLLCLPRLLRERRLWALLRAALLTGGLCLFFLVPFLSYSAEGIGAGMLRGLAEFEAIEPAQLLFWTAGEEAPAPQNHRLEAWPAEIGFALLLGSLLTLRHFVLHRAPERDARDRHAASFLLLGVAWALAATTLFPWSYVRVLTGGLSDYLQFPWRTLVMADALLCVAAAYGYVRFAGKRGDAATVAVFTLCAVMALPTLTEQTRKEPYLEFGEGAKTAITYPEYQIPGTDVSQVGDRTAHADGVLLTEYVKEGTCVRAHVSAREDGTLSLPLFAFTGYEVTLGGEKIPWTRGENNRLSVAIPAGTDAALDVRFVIPRLWRVADAISLAALALWIGLFCRMRRAQRAAQTADACASLRT